jgi:thiol-disulfide isomerase/thioredoxin
MSRRGLTLLLAVSVTAAAAGFALQRGLFPPAPPTVYVQSLPLTDLDGETRDLAEWDGKLRLVNFWASWCAPCLREIPMLVEAQRDLGGRGLKILGPALDDPAAARTFAERLQVNYPVFAGTDDVLRAMQALGDTRGALPFSVLIARDGRILSHHYGELTRAQLDAMLAAHIGD